MEEGRPQPTQPKPDPPRSHRKGAGRVGAKPSGGRKRVRDQGADSVLDAGAEAGDGAGDGEVEQQQLLQQHQHQPEASNGAATAAAARGAPGASGRGGKKANTHHPSWDDYVLIPLPNTRLHLVQQPPSRRRPLVERPKNVSGGLAEEVEAVFGKRHTRQAELVESRDFWSLATKY